MGVHDILSGNVTFSQNTNDMINYTMGLVAFLLSSMLFNSMVTLKDIMMYVIVLNAVCVFVIAGIFHIPIKKYHGEYFLFSAFTVALMMATIIVLYCL